MTREHDTTRDLQDRIERLESLDGEGTELVTVTIPPDTALESIRERIAGEHASARGIKSDRTRERVRRALSRVERELRRYDETPASGLVIYAGVIDGDLHCYVFDDLPTPVAESTYHCDDGFDLTALRRAVVPDETFGLLVVERGGAAIGRLVGDRIDVIDTLESQVMGHTRAGGQSARRFQRERERQLREFFGQVAGIVERAFLEDGEPVAGLAVGGTTGTAKRFLAETSLDHRLRDRVIGPYAIDDTTVRGLQRLVDAAESELLDVERRERRERLDAFFARLREGETVAYGREAIERAIEFGAVETALLARTLPPEEREELAEAVEERGGETYVIASESERGERFVETFEIGALLRFPVE